MQINFVFTKDMTEKDNRELSYVNSICFQDAPDEACMLNYVADSLGKFLLYNDDGKIVGRNGIHIRKSEYDGEIYTLGGFGGLGVLPEYRGHGYATILTKMAIDKLYEIKADIAVMCVDRNKTVYEFYEKYGFCFLDRNAYFINALGEERFDDSVMIRGICNKNLAEKILTTEYKFHYGDDYGYW